MSSVDNDKRRAALDNLIKSQVDLKLLEEVDFDAGMDISKSKQELCKLRKLIGALDNIYIIIDSGVCPKLVEFLSLDKYPIIQLESAWILCNVAAGTSEQTRYIHSIGSTSHFIRLLASHSEDVVEQAIWCLGNITGDGIELRDSVINYGAVPHIISAYNSTDRIQMKRTIAWVISNLVKNKPYPTKETLDAALKFVVKILFHETDAATLTDSLWAISYMLDNPGNEMDTFKSCADELVNSNVLPIIIEHAFSSNRTSAAANKAINNMVLAGEEHYCKMLIDAGLLMAFCLRFESKGFNMDDFQLISNLAQASRSCLQAILDAQVYWLLMQFNQTFDTAAPYEICNMIAKSFLQCTPEQFNQLISSGCLELLCKCNYNQSIETDKLVVNALEHILQFPNKNEPQKNNKYARMIDEYDGFQILQKFASSGDGETNKKAQYLLSTYFNENHDENNKISQWNKNSVADDLDKIFSEDCICLINREINHMVTVEIIKWMDKNEKRLKILILRNLRMDQESKSMLFKYLSRNKFIKEIYFERSIDDHCMKELGEILSANDCIEKICLGYCAKGNHITNQGLDTLAKNLKESRSLRLLSLSNNSAINDASLPYVIDMIKKSKIERVFTHGTSLSNSKEIQISTTVNKILNGGDYVSLSSISLNDNEIDPVCKALKESSGFLRAIILKNNAISAVGASKLFESLEDHDDLKLISLGNNNLGDDFIESFARFMQHSQSLTYLNLSNNFITDKLALAMLDSLRGNKVFTALSLLENDQITDAFVEPLIEIIKCSGLRYVDLLDTYVSANDLDKIRRSLRTPFHERDLPLDSKSKSAAKIA